MICSRSRGGAPLGPACACASACACPSPCRPALGWPSSPEPGEPSIHACAACIGVNQKGVYKWQVLLLLLLQRQLRKSAPHLPLPFFINTIKCWSVPRLFNHLHTNFFFRLITFTPTWFVTFFTCPNQIVCRRGSYIIPGLCVVRTNFYLTFFTSPN